MHRDLSHDYHLPDVKSKGCTKEYLNKVFTNSVYTVDRIKIKQFLVQELEYKRVLKYQWRNDVEYKRLDAFLKSIGRKPLGFNLEDGYPNEQWLMEIARYEDPLNILDIYGFQGPQRHDMNYSNNKLSRRKDKLNAITELLYSENMRAKAKWKMTFNEAKTKHKMCINEKAHIEKLQKQLEKAHKDLQMFESEKSALQGQLLSMCDGPKSVQIDYRLIADPTNNSLERQKMIDFMYGWLFLLVF